MTRLILVSAFALAAGMTGTSASAAPREVPEAQLVSYADLDLGSGEGRARLEQRVRSAADRLCREDLRASPEGGYLDGKCFRAAVSDGLHQVQLAVARAESRQASADSAITLARR